jgi:hypothetical protein
MGYRWLVPVLASMALLFGLSARTDAQSDVFTSGNTGSMVFAILPISAQVRLDGVPIGTARELTGQSVVVFPGPHVVEVSAEKHVTSVVDVRGFRGWYTVVNVELVPDRRP